MVRKNWLSVLSFCLALILFSGMAMSPALAAGKTQVVIWHTFTEEQEKSLKEIADAYNAANPGVEVVVQSQPYKGFTDKVFSAVRSQSGPNLIINFSSEAAKYVDGADDKNTFVVDYAKYLKPEELEALKASLPSKVFEECVGFEDGKCHILPVYTSGPILFYNKTMYDELGLKAPTTWAELESNARQIKEKYNVPGFAADSLIDTATILMMQNGSSYLDVAAKKVLIDDPKAAERVQWFGDLIKEGVFAQAPTGDYYSTDFSSKLIGSYFGSCAGYKYLKPDGFELGVAPAVIDGVNPWYPAWNRGAIAFKTTEEQDKATVDFVRFFINPENSAKFCMAVGSLSPYKETAELENYKAYLADPSLLSQTLNAVQATLQYAAVLPIVKVSSTVRQEIERAVTRVATGEMSAADALKEAAEICTKEWANP